MAIRKTGRFLAALAAALSLASCSSVGLDARPSAINIKTVASNSGKILRANIKIDEGAIYFYGRLDSRVRSGHIDTSVLAPNGVTECIAVDYKKKAHGSVRRAGHRLLIRKTRQWFSVQLDVLPEEGSLVSVWHHEGEVHKGCS